MERETESEGEREREREQKLQSGNNFKSKVEDMQAVTYSSFSLSLEPDFLGSNLHSLIY